MEWPKITKDTPLEEVKRIHQLIWDYVIENDEKPDTPYICSCAACEYVAIHWFTDNIGCINKCPIAWETSISCYNKESIHAEWYYCSDPTQKSKLARQIRDMPFKYELKNSDNN